MLINLRRSEKCDVINCIHLFYLDVKGGMHLPQMDSARLIVGTWWIVVMVVVATYSGNLIAALTFPRMDTPILTVEDLLSRSDEFTWGFPNGSFLEEYLQGNDLAKYKSLLANSERQNSSSLYDNLNRIREGKHVFIDWRSSLTFLMRKDYLITEKCSFFLSPVDFLHEPMSMMVAQDSPYLQLINRA